MTKEEFMRQDIYPNISEMDALKIFLERSSIDLGSRSYSKRTRNPEPTEEEKMLFIKQYEQYAAKRSRQHL